MALTTNQNSANQSTANAVPANAQLVKIASGKKDVVTKKNSELLFNPATKEFIVIPPSQATAFDTEVKSFDAFKPYMDAFLPNKVQNEKEQAAYIKAVLFYIEKFVKATNDKEANDLIAKLPQLIPEKKEEILKKPNSFTPSSLKSGEIVQYLRFRENRTVNLRTSKNKPFHKTYKLDTEDLNQELKKRKEREKNKEEPPKPISERMKETNSAIRKAINKAQKEETAESKIFEESLWEEASKPLFKLANENFFEDINQFDAGISAQVLRAATEAKFGSTIDFKNVNVKISGKAEGSISVFESKGHFNIFLPDFNGIDIIAMLRKEDPRLVYPDAKPLRLMLKITLEGAAFVGACASIGLEAGVGLKGKESKSNDGKFDASLDLFAGAKVKADVLLTGNMKLIKDEKTPHQAEAWDELGTISYGGWAAVGIGLEAAFRIGYWDSRIRMVAKIGVVLKAGAGTHISVAIDPIKIGILVYTVGVSLNFRGMSEILDEKVHALYQSVMLNCFYTGQTIKEVARLMSSDVERVLESSSLLAETGLSVFQSVDNTFDQYIPGYSGFKKSSAAFWILKEAYYSLKRSNTQTMIRNAAIKMVQEATQQNRWKYATWQLKANLIADMCTGSGGWIEFAEEDKEDAIIQVVRTFRYLNEANKIEASLARQNKIIANELDGAQLAEYQTIKSNLK